MDYVLLVVPSAYDDVINPGKGCMTIPKGPVQVSRRSLPQVNLGETVPLANLAAKSSMLGSG